MTGQTLICPWGIDMKKCFACGKKLLKGQIARVDTRDEQIVEVGPTCYHKVILSGDIGYKPPLGGLRLWNIKNATEVRFN